MTGDRRTVMIGIVADVSAAAVLAAAANLIFDASSTACVLVFFAGYLLSPVSVAINVMSAHRAASHDEMVCLSPKMMPASLVAAGMFIHESDGTAAEVTDVAETGLGGSWVRVRTSSGCQHTFHRDVEVTIFLPCGDH